MNELVVKELGPSLREDFLLFFDHVAFADNSDWSDDLSIDERTYLFSRSPPDKCEG